METTESPRHLNAVRHYVVYEPGDRPRVEVCLRAGAADVGTWAPGELRMHTRHEDGSQTFTAQYLLHGRLLIDNFPRARVR
jgi:hypothetical protein